MGTIIKQLADGIILSGDNNFDTNLGKVFINNHEITDIDTFFKVAEENTRLLEQCKKQKEAIDDYKEDISNLLNIINKNCYELKCTSDEWLVIQKYQDKEVSE